MSLYLQCITSVLYFLIQNDYTFYNTYPITNLNLIYKTYYHLPNIFNIQMPYRYLINIIFLLIFGPVDYQITQIPLIISIKTYAKTLNLQN